jgi:hypothetical protein
MTVIPKVCSADPKGSETTSLGTVNTYNSVMATTQFIYTSIFN